MPSRSNKSFGSGGSIRGKSTNRSSKAGYTSTRVLLTDMRILASNRVEEPHQLSGTPRSLVQIESISQGQEEHSYPSKDGKQDSSVLHEPDGGNTFHSAEQPGNPTLAVMLGKESIHHSRTSSWG